MTQTVFDSHSKVLYHNNVTVVHVHLTFISLLNCTESMKQSFMWPPRRHGTLVVLTHSLLGHNPKSFPKKQQMLDFHQNQIFWQNSQEERFAENDCMFFKVWFKEPCCITWWRIAIKQQRSLSPDKKLQASRSSRRHLFLWHFIGAKLHERINKKTCD